ncbi:MAG: right-handed parallel beta-helix repeat-containing protein [Acidobacteria bacterium]|nr:right-handed parallel beta-helix repeat-containing protein [Acidobacteriota bacterium]
MKTSSWLAISLIASTATLLSLGSQPAGAATLCVNPGSVSGCFKTIGAAVAAASAGDTIQVTPGTYSEDVTIGKSLSLIGANSANTIIDARGQPNGVYIDGLDNAGLSEVVVAGFTVQNANFEGILITNASSVTVWGNRVVSNDLAFNASAASCPGLPAFETSEGMDCGEGIHLSGVDHSTVANNFIQNNSGGVLISDDTGLTHDNLITGNVARDNPYDCGITLASHPLYSELPSNTPRGVDRNTISDNDSSKNGLAVEGAGAGVGLFVAPPGLETSGNVVVGNRLTGNGLPGVAFHLHTASPGQNLNNNLIVGNYIADNGADTEDAATPGPTGINVFGVAPITGIAIVQNVIKNEAVDIATNTAALVDVHLNNLLGQQIGVDNLDGGMVNATENWWGCAKGPGSPGCTSVSGYNVASTPFLTRPAVTSSPE